MDEHWPVLTIRQPWCWAIEHAGKAPENRSWNVKYRGPVWLQSGARSRWDPAGAAFPQLREAWERHVRAIPSWPGLPSSDVELSRRTTLMTFGAVTSLAEVTGCHHFSACTVVAPVRGCTPWAAHGQFHIELELLWRLPAPVPCRGSLGLWYPLAEVERALFEQLDGSPVTIGQEAQRG